MDLDLEERVRRANSCFGCGKLNSYGLMLEVEVTDGVARAVYRSREEHQGFPGVLHGGIVAALLDEVMGWAMVAVGLWAVTAKIDLRFRRPVPVGADLALEAHIEKQRGRTLSLRSAARDLASGDLLVEAEGLFVRVPAARQQELDGIYQPDLRI